MGFQEAARKMGAAIGVTQSSLGRIEPMGDRIMVEPMPDEGEQTSPGGIVLVKTGRADPPNRGKVLAVGPGRTTDQGVLIPTNLVAGAEILFGKYSGTELEVAGKKVLIIRESDVFAVLR